MRGWGGAGASDDATVSDAISVDDPRTPRPSAAPPDPHAPPRVRPAIVNRLWQGPATAIGRRILGDERGRTLSALRVLWSNSAARAVSVSIARASASKSGRGGKASSSSPSRTPASAATILGGKSATIAAASSDAPAVALAGRSGTGSRRGGEPYVYSGSGSTPGRCIGGNEGGTR